MGAVPFINCFEVPAGREDVFFDLWQEVLAYMSAKPGCVSHRLHRSLTPDARFRFVNYAEWETAGDWQAAHDDGVPEARESARVGRVLLEPQLVRGPSTTVTRKPQLRRVGRPRIG